MGSVWWSKRVVPLVLVAGVAFWVVNAVLRWWLSAALGHDEARYALDASDLLSGGSNRFLFSGGAMQVVGVPGVLAGGSERALRFVPLLLGGGFIGAVWLVAHRTCGRDVAAFTVAFLGTSPHLAVHSSELLSDLPSSACLLFALLVAYIELTHAEGIRWRLVAIAPLFALAFYLRYGSLPAIAAIALGGLVFGYREVAKRPTIVIATGLLFVVLLVPHVVRSIEQTGSMFGVLRLSAEIPGEREGLVGYIKSPLWRYGPILPLVCVIGVLSALRGDRTTRLLVFIGVAQILALANTTQAQPRFIYFAMVLLTIAGTRELLALRHRLVLALASIVCLALWANHLRNALSHSETRFGRDQATLVAATMIRADARGRRCTVEGNADSRRVEWYSGCRYQSFRGDEPVAHYRVEAARQPATLELDEIRIAYLPGLVDILRSVVRSDG